MYITIVGTYNDNGILDLERLLTDIHGGPSSRPSILRKAALLQVTVGDLARIVQARDRERAERYGLSPSHLHALLTLNRVGPLTVTQLGDHLYLEKSTASRLAKGLLGLDLARKRSPESDDRKVIVQVTEKGMRLSRRILNDISDEYVGLLASMSPEAREALPALLEKLTRRLSGLPLDPA